MTISFAENRPHRAPSASAWQLDGRLLSAVFAGLLLVALVPIFSVEILPLVDYPNHIARMRILSDYSRSPGLQAIYRIDWALMPNLAMDLIVPQMARFLGVLLAGQIFVAMTLAMIAAGTLLLHRTLFERASLWPLTIFLFLYNDILSLGFLNYLFGVGGALILFALWVRCERWPLWTRLTVFPLCTFLLIISHLGALAVYGLMVVCYEFWRLSGLPPRRLAGAVHNRALACQPDPDMPDTFGLTAFFLRGAVAGLQFIPPLVLLLLASPPPLAEGHFGYLLHTKAMALQAPFVFFRQPFDGFLALAVLVTLFVLWRRRWITIAPAAVFPLVGLLLAVIAMPSWLMGNWGNDFRLMLPLVCLLIAGTDLKVPVPRFGLALVMAAAIFSVRITTLTVTWLDYDRLFDELRAAAGSLESGSRVLPAIDNWNKVGQLAPTAYPRTFYNSPALLALQRDIYLPTLFTAAGRQPLSVAPAYAETNVPHALPLRLERLRLAANPDSAEELYRTRLIGDYSYKWADWPHKFDYLLMLNFDAPSNPLPEILTPRHQGTFFTIYAVRPPTGTTPQ